MCFSAGASFTAATTLVLLYALNRRKAKTPAQHMFAAITLFFAIQQALEGIVWQGLNQQNTASLLHDIGVYGYLFFALIFWPLWVPLTLYFLEKDKQQKKYLVVTLIFGCLFSLYQATILVLHGSQAQILNCNIHYSFHTPETFYVAGLLIYLLATVAPMFLSSLRGMKLLGSAVGISLLISLLWYEATLVSVWCFFAAIISLGIMKILEWNPSSPKQRRTRSK